MFGREVGDGRLRFAFTAICHETTGIEADIEWLVAAARMVRHLGASRRRGQGACLWKLTRVEVDGQRMDVDQNTWLDRFGQRYLKDQTPAPRIRIQPAEASFARLSTDTPVRFWLLVRTEEPLLVAERSEAANQFDTRPSIPGTTVRGALAGCISARYPQVQQSAGAVYKTFVELFFGGAVRFPCLYPGQYLARHNTLHTTIPAPRDFLSCELYRGFERGMHGARGYAVEPHIPNCPECQRQGAESALKPLAEGFIPLRDTLSLVQPEQAMEMHIALNPETGRVKTGDLYGYVALEAGQYFIGELWCASSAAWEALRTLANLPAVEQPFTLHLGKAVRRGYGRVTAWLLPPPKERLWTPQPLSQRVTTAQSPITLTLLSDAIIQDHWGRFQTAFEPDWLKEELGLEVDIIRQFVAGREMDSFNAHLGLLRHREMAIRAGSAVGFRLKGTPPGDWQTKLEQVEQSGLGLRREEGFGRVAFNHPVYQGNQGAGQYVQLKEASGQRLASPSDHLLTHQEVFRSTWELILNNTDWQACRDKQGHFVQVGRLIQAACGMSLPMIDRMLSLLEQETNLLDQRLEGRKKVHFFQDPDQGQPGLEQVRQLIGRLEETIKRYETLATEQRRDLQRLGLTMLASKVADVAAQARDQSGGGR